jgi:hypothetical protein
MFQTNRLPPFSGKYSTLKTASSSEKLVRPYQTRRCHVAENWNSNAKKHLRLCIRGAVNNIISGYGGDMPLVSVGLCQDVRWHQDCKQLHRLPAPTLRSKMLLYVHESIPKMFRRLQIHSIQVDLTCQNCARSLAHRFSAIRDHLGGHDPQFDSHGLTNLCNAKWPIYLTEHSVKLSSLAQHQQPMAVGVVK